MTMLIDRANMRAVLNPIPMQALALLSECRDDFTLALYLAEMKIIQASDPRGWLAVYAVLNGEKVGQA